VEQEGHVACLKRLDHVAVAVRELEEAAQAWERNLGLKVERVFQPAGSDVRLASLSAGNAFVELAQPLTSDHRLAAFMDEQGEGMFALSIEVDDLEAVVAELRGRGVQVSDPEPGVWEGTRLARISRESSHGVAIHLLQRQ
jgi:methylmalonyl-CoA epimerase